MINTVVLDLFLGDSGKGKIVDYLAQFHSSVVRFNGANNAGHTLVVDGETYKTHAVPSGMLHGHTCNYISHGCIMDPYILSNEINEFRSKNGRTPLISGGAHIILPSHIETDIERENKFKIGSTKRGVAPAFESKSARRGLQFKDLLLSENEFDKRLEVVYPATFFEKIFSSKYKQLIKEAKQVRQDFDKFKHLIIPDGVDFMHYLLKKGGVLFEGAQGTFLDIDFGDYPYVTSSNCTIGSVLTGTGANMHQIDEIVGVIKAYGSYVGTNANFEDIKDKGLNKKLCKLGQEYGATTGRRRRLCWLDLDRISQAVAINGPTKLVITRMDTLGQMPVAYIKYDGAYHKFKTWGDLKQIKSIQDLPQEAIKFLKFIEEKLQVPMWAIGIGPERKDLLEVRNFKE